jgi:signal peptidase I
VARRPRAEPISPTRFLHEGVDPTGRTGQAGFAALLLILLGLFALWRLGPARVEGWGRGHEALAVIPLAVLLVPATGHVLRRLNDIGWGGWWAWALALPWVRWPLLALLLAMPTSQRRRRTDSRWRLLGLGAAGLVSLALAGSLVWTTVGVAGEGMKPTLRPGELLLVRRAPIEARPGDVIAFRMPGEAAPRVSRVIAIGGERVAVEAGAPVVGGAPVERVRGDDFLEVFGRQGPEGLMPLCGNGAVGIGALCRTRSFEETLAGGAAYPVLDLGRRPLDAMEEVTVPDGALFVMGDHRDAAQDSRLSPAVNGTGFVREAQVIGRGRHGDRVLLRPAPLGPAGLAARADRDGGAMKLSGSLKALSERLGHEFRDPALLIRALTHGSRGGGEGDNQRLEFLGDRVLGLVMAEALLAADPTADEGRIAPRFNALVRRETCAEVARAVDLGAGTEARAVGNAGRRAAQGGAARRRDGGGDRGGLPRRRAWRPREGWCCGSGATGSRRRPRMRGIARPLSRNGRRRGGWCRRATTSWGARGRTTRRASSSRRGCPRARRNGPRARPSARRNTRRRRRC